MTRVSLKEAYDNKDVVAQIYAIRDIAEGANDTANGAVTTANTASEHVDSLVPQVEGAVQTANNASASAQQSATTVAGYDTRLTAMEDADTQNVKLEGNQNIAGIKTVPTEATGTRSQQIANSEKVGAELDNYAHMLRTTGDQNFSGIKNTTSNFVGTYYGSVGIDKSNGFVIAERDTNVNIVEKPTITRYFPPLLFEDGGGNRIGGIRIVHNADGTCSFCVSLRNANGTSKNIILATSDP